MVVTSLRAEPRTPGWVVVEIDGLRFATLPVDVAAGLRIEERTELSREALDRLAGTANVEAAHRVALRLLAARPRARGDLVRRLRERGHDPAAATEAVARLEARGLVDDAEFARHFARVRAARGHGPARMRSDLMALGVDDRVAQGAIAEVAAVEGIDPVAQARSMVIKRAAQLGPMTPVAKRRRLLAYLARRGFRGQEVREMVVELLRA